MNELVPVQVGSPASSPDSDGETAIRAIEASSAFQRAPVLRRLLLYLWEHRESMCSEYGIGVDVLGRRPDFDPKLDATVRVHVSRLRQKLRDFQRDEGESLAVRIVLPAGSHRLQVERVAPVALPTPEIFVPAIEPRRDWRPWIISAGAVGCLLVAVILFLGVALWRASHERVPAPDLPAFWTRVLGNGKLTRIVFPTPIFLQSGKLRLRDVTVNDPDGISQSAALGALNLTSGKTSLSDHYSVTSDTLALASLLKLLANRGIPVEVSATRDLSLDLFGSDNLLFLGIPPTSPHVEQLLSRTEFYLRPGGMTVGIRNPRSGEPKQFTDIQKGTDLTTYGIVSVLPGRAAGTKLILVSGAKTYALAAFLTSPVTLADLEKFLQQKRLPEYFEMVVEARVEGSKLLKARPAAFRTVPASLWK